MILLWVLGVVVTSGLMLLAFDIRHRIEGRKRGNKTRQIGG